MRVEGVDGELCTQRCLQKAGAGVQLGDVDEVLTYAAILLIKRGRVPRERDALGCEGHSSHTKGLRRWSYDITVM